MEEEIRYISNRRCDHLRVYASEKNDIKSWWSTQFWAEVVWDVMKYNKIQMKNKISWGKTFWRPTEK